MPFMTVILGIDAAWTPHQPSGVALVASDRNAWRALAIAPSYDSFLALGEGQQDWSRQLRGSAPDVAGLLRTARRIARAPVDLVAVDMPLAAVSIVGRRAADDAISREFGSRHCSAHSPNATRPGALGAALSTAFAAAGFSLATVDTKCGALPKLLEVYPHPALLACFAGLTGFRTRSASGNATGRRAHRLSE